MTDEQAVEIILEAWDDAGLLTTSASDQDARLAYTKLVRAQQLAEVAAQAVLSTARLAGVPHYRDNIPFIVEFE